LGASADRSKFGNKAVRAFVEKGWNVYPINPREQMVEAIPCHASISHLPLRPEIVSVYLPPPVLLNLLPEIAAKGCDELWLNPGTESGDLLARAEELGLNVIQACSIMRIGMSPGAL